MMLFQQIEQAIAEWKQVLGLADWQFDVYWQTDDAEAFAECEAKPRYAKAKLRFNVDRLAGMSAAFVEETVVHELVHCLTWAASEFGLYGREFISEDLAVYFDELQTTELTAALLRARQHGLDSSVNQLELALGQDAR